MNKGKIFFCIALCAAAIGCQKEPQGISTGGREEQPVAGVSESATIPGVMKIRVSDELAERLLAGADETGLVSDPAAAGLTVPGIEIKSVSTTFLIGGKFEARQREAGLHKWFTVSYDENVPLTRASGNLSQIEGIELTEPALKIRKTSVTMNDPQYPSQWHYNNTGQNGFTAGVDMRLQEAWDTYGVFGNENVTVAIMDGGVDITHPDIQPNLWVNEAELNGTPGRDDDGNGYADDIYGFNFITNNADISGEAHGTHVAGTVAAANNNGIGVCGVAGGRNPDQPGVRLMCLQIMDERHPDTGCDNARFFQYAADNGANIAQCSWGYEESPSQMLPSDAAAIDYFIDNAGIDENGNQTGPMRGGLVVFAAGNNAQNYDFPSGYERVIAVGAIGPYGKAAYYTNYGSWVDVCAPGGDQMSGGNYGGVLSTVNGGQYGYLQGTSMACPHVSGLAALVLSVKGQDGFTWEDLFDIIVSSTDPSIYDYNPDMRGQLGTGMIDAVLALSSISTEAPEPLSHIEVEARANNLFFTVDVPADPDNTTAYYYNVYYGTSRFSESDLSDAELFRTTVKDAEDAGDGLKSFVLRGLDFNTGYYYAISASDFAGNESALSDVMTVSTGSNNAPAITVDSDEPLVAKAYGSYSRTYTATDPDGHSVELSCTLTGNPGVTSEQLAENVVKVTVNGASASEGTRSFTLTAVDEYGARTDKEVEYTVLPNHAPVLVEDFGTVCVNGTGATVSIAVADHVTDEDGGPLSVLLSIADRDIVSFIYSDEVITFTGKALGVTKVSLTVTDAKGASVQTSFNVVVRDSSKPYDIYPNPVTDYLNIRTPEASNCSVELYSATGSQIYSGEGVSSIDEPMQVDMKNAAPGQYTLRLNLNGQEYQASVVKL